MVVAARACVDCVARAAVTHTHARMHAGAAAGRRSLRERKVSQKMAVVDESARQQVRILCSESACCSQQAITERASTSC